MTTGFVDEPRLAGLMVRETVRRLRGVGPAIVGFAPLAGRRAGRILAVPVDLRRAEPSFVETFYSGRLSLAGHDVEFGSRSPFLLRGAPRSWMAELHGFGWLRHFTETGDALSAEQARVLVADWLVLDRRALPRLAFDHEVAARRLISWLAHAPIVLAQAHAPFRRRFETALAREARRLSRASASAPEGLPRLLVRIALATAALCQPGRRSLVRPAAKLLSDELDRQIYPDGGHISRNPAAIPALLADLLPLRQLFAHRNQAVPRALFSAIDRMLPALRFFLHGDGAVALFNGAALADRSLLALLLRYDETLGEPASALRQTGYQRLAAGGTVLLADTGLPPAPAHAGEAHAGTLAFEFSSGRRRMVVNCGATTRAEDAGRRLARNTAAHSTLVLGDHSSSRFAKSPILDRYLGVPLLPGPTRVPASREDTGEGHLLTAAHDGYRLPFGFVHERQIHLSGDGRRIEGVDRLFQATGRNQRPAGDPPLGMLRFHLHPDVTADETQSGIRLQHGDEIWWFRSEVPARLEDSIFFADPAGARPSAQISVVFDPMERTQLGWCFER
ncbi:heparinase II/III family protein [Aureimonas ureilytica]|uniref:heparinase II/III family protein n=1 Tax=Aureimonas ureilytica TaxID=401562 RepID=UPI00035E0D39|nr:heparinase II/III family protein [Aureimonas ureilytica]